MKQGEHAVIPYHDGRMLRERVEESYLRAADIARSMNTTQSTLLGYYETESLRTETIRRASLALKRNLFFDMGMRLPKELPSSLNTEPMRRVAELEAENARLRIENETYRDLLKR